MKHTAPVHPGARRHRTPTRPRNGAGGFVLIEVLVALLIFCFAALGLVGLQVAMTRATTGAKFRADASYLATDLVGRIWSDANNLSSYDSASCASYAPCKAWQDKVGATLPGSTAAATVSSNGTVSIALTWQVPNESAHSLNTITSVNPNAQ